MSLQMKIARGDPGFLGSLLKGIGGAVSGFVTGGPLGAVTGGIKGVMSGSKPKASDFKDVTGGSSSRAAIAGGVSGYALPVSLSTVQRINATSMPGTGQPSGLMLASGNDPGPGKPGALVQASRNMGFGGPGAAPSGYHLNKTGYWVNGSALIPGAHYVGPGTQLVRNRRANPLNPHALSRSLRRLAGFARATKHMRSEAHKIATSVAGKPRTAARCGCKKGK